jgi:C4-dicarboxylate-specific signal transduction histidine kinase
VTPNTRSITGWQTEELGERVELWKLAPAEDQLRRAENYLKAHREGWSVTDYRLRQPGGGYCWLRNEVVVIRRHGDGSADVVGAVTNVTHEHELALQASQMNRMATLGEIATSIAHELSQPVTVITMAASYAQSLAVEMGGAGELGRQIDVILTQGERAGEIIRHLRSYGHADGGALGAVDLRDAVAGAMVLAGQPLAEAKVLVEVEWPVDPPLVRARLVQVEQVLLNLFINARDAMRAVPDSHRRLRIFTEVGDAGVEMHVADSGPGVPPEVMPRLFEPFFTTKAMGEGTGLGLSLCRTMMEGFGGTISVRNAEVGSVFNLRFAVAERMFETG